MADSTKTKDTKDTKQAAPTTEVHVAADLGYDLSDPDQRQAAIDAQLAALDLPATAVESVEAHPDGGLKLTVSTGPAAKATH